MPALKPPVKTFIVIVMESAASNPAKRKMGRPRSFDRDAALETAMLTFWRYGYETTSIADLTSAMGVTAPSIYSAFGDKKKLFLEVVRRYVDRGDDVRKLIEAAPSAYDAVHGVLTAAAATYTGDTTPPGCLLASATASGSAASSDVQAIVAAIRHATRTAIQDRIERDIRDGLLPLNADPVGLAGLVVALLQGLSVMARDGMTRASLLSIIDLALAAWPTRQAL